MSKRTIILLGLVLFSLLLVWAEFRHLSQIEDNVELRSQQALNTADFVQVIAHADGRDVTLSGVTADATRRVAAEALVESLAGVRTIHNEISVADQETKEADSDVLASEANGENTAEAAQEPVTEEPTEALATETAYKFSVASRNDGVFLSGKVFNEAEKNKLENQARLAFTELPINNRLSVGASALASAESLAAHGFGMLTELGSGTLDVDDRGLRVNGRVKSAERRELLENKLTQARTENPSLRIVSNIVVAGALDNRICQAELNRLIESEKILFENEKAAVNRESYALLDSLADVSKRCNAHIEIGGHTDSYGDDEFNQWLSEQRAGAVKAYLIKNEVPQERLSSVGYGETQPISKNTTRKLRAKNRRIEFRVSKAPETRQ